MARIRSVHPAICRDEVLAECTASAERTFVRLWCHLDDEGRAVDNPKLIKADLYPLHDHMDSDAVDADLNELAGLGLIVRYVVDGRRLLAVKPDAWARYQKPRHPRPSDLPGPEGSTDRFPADSGNVTAFRRKPPAGVGDGEGEGVVAAADKPPKRKTSPPKDWAPTDGHAKKAVEASLDLRFEAQQFLDFHAAKGTKFVDWDRAFHTWLGNATKWKRERAQASGEGRPRW